MALQNTTTALHCGGKKTTTALRKERGKSDTWRCKTYTWYCLLKGKGKSDTHGIAKQYYCIAGKKKTNSVVLYNLYAYHHHKGEILLDVVVSNNDKLLAHITNVCCSAALTWFRPRLLTDRTRSWPSGLLLPSPIQ